MTVLRGPVLYYVDNDPPDQGLILTKFRWDRRDAYCGDPATYHEAASGQVYVNPEHPERALELIFSAYNRGSGQEVEFDGPSLSTGDVVHMGEASWRCALIGWERAR